MKDFLIDLLMLALLAAIITLTITHIIGLYGAPEEIIGSAVYKIIN